MRRTVSELLEIIRDTHYNIGGHAISPAGNKMIILFWSTCDIQWYDPHWFVYSIDKGKLTKHIAFEYFLELGSHDFQITEMSNKGVVYFNSAGHCDKTDTLKFAINKTGAQPEKIMAWTTSTCDRATHRATLTREQLYNIAKALLSKEKRKKKTMRRRKNRRRKNGRRPMSRR